MAMRVSKSRRSGGRSVALVSTALLAAEREGRRTRANNLQTLRAAVAQQIKGGEVRDKPRPSELGISGMYEMVVENLDVVRRKNLFP
jgi:hypothetical protein